jgi:hypothetical protein
LVCAVGAKKSLLEEKGQAYVHAGEGDWEKENSEKVIIFVNVPHCPHALSTIRYLYIPVPIFSRLLLFPPPFSYLLITERFNWIQ